MTEFPPLPAEFSRQLVEAAMKLRNLLTGVTILFCSELFADELTHAKFLQLHKQLRPAPDEVWRTIPWKISLIDAQHVAAQDKKPIFIWAMDGHPLGCT